MDKELKAKWVEALRSGEFQQGTNALKTEGNGFCCLGVLCAVQGANFDDIKEQYGTLQLMHNPKKYLDILPEAVRVDLAGKNDRGCPFSEIADYIEREL